MDHESGVGGSGKERPTLAAPRRRALLRVAGLGLVPLALLGLAGGVAQAASYKVGSFVKITGVAPVAQVVPHGLGETPKALILWTNGKTNEAFSGGALYGFGVSDGTASASVATDLRDAIASNYTGSSFASGSVITISLGSGGGTIAQAALTSWNATDFSLNWTTNDANAYVVHFIVIGGSEISAKVVEWNRNTTTGNQSIGTVGFRPDVVIHAEADMTVPGDGSKGVVVLGAMDASGGQWAQSIFSGGDAAPPTQTQRAQSTTACFYQVYSGVIAHQASFFSMDASGFTVNHTVNDGLAARTFSLALKGMQARVASFNKSTLVAPAAQAVNAGIWPRMVLLASVQNTPAAGVVAEARYGIGASDGSTEGSSAFQDQNAVNPSNVDGIDKTSKVFVKVNNSTPTINAEADLTGFTETGFNLNWTTNDGVVTQILYLALGDVTTYYRSIGTNATPYITGQVNVTTGSSLVTGTGGTTWKTSNRGRGDQITINAVNYTILSVNSNTELVLTTPFQGISNSYSYSITRKFNGLQAWYNCVDGTIACPGGGANLVTTRRKEVGIAYKDGTLTLAGTLSMGTATTSATYDITLTADPGNRHLGLFGTGVVISSNGNSIRPLNSFMTIEWLEFRNGSPRALHINNIGSPNKLVIRYCLFDGSVPQPMTWFGPHDADIYNNIIYGSNNAIDIIGSTVNLYNNTIYNVSGNAIVASGGTVTLRNNIAHTCGGCFNVPGRTAASSNNLSSDTSATTHSPAGGGINSVPLTGPLGVNFVNAAGGNLHINSGSRAKDAGADLSGLFTQEIDDLGRLTPWDIGADEASADLAITKDDGQATAVVGGPITYTITVTNLGQSGVTGAMGATVTDTLPASLTGASWNCAASPGSSCASSGSGNILDTINLLVGGTLTYTLSATIDPGAASPLDNTATVTPPAGVIDPDSTNNADTDTDTLISPADLQALKSGLATALLGQTIAYSVTAKNNGPANASGVVTLVDTLPPEVEFLSSTPAGPDCSYSAASHRLTCSIASLAASATFPVSIDVRVVSPGSIVNVASVSGLDPDIPGNNTATFTTDVGVPSDEVQFFTVTSRKGENVLEWLYPAMDYNTVRIVFNTGITSCAYPMDPMGGDGTILLPPPPPGSVNGHDSYLHAGLTDTHEYCYTIFVDKGGSNYSVGRSNRGRPFDTSCPSCYTKWAYSVGNTSMAPPGIGVDVVHAVANDNALHSMRKAGRLEEGTWPSGWRPKDTGGPSQGRPTTINIPTGFAARVIFLGSQNGNVYAIDADAGGPGHVWATPFATLWAPGTKVQATPSGVFTAFTGSRDYVLVGTRLPDQDNAFYALDRVTGTPVAPWPFTGTGPTDKIGVINFQASVDYANHLLYFTSFARGGGLGSNTVWCLDFWTMGVVWKKAYANVTTSPVVLGNRVYVGTSTGEVLALRTSDGGLDWSEATGDGPVKGFIAVERVSGDIYFSTTTEVHARRANGSVKWDKPFVSPSTPVILAGRSRVYVGTGDGWLHGLNELDGGDEPFFPIQIGDGAAGVGSVTIDTREGHLYVGTEAGIIYAVSIP